MAHWTVLATQMIIQVPRVWPALDDVARAEAECATSAASFKATAASPRRLLLYRPFGCPRERYGGSDDHPRRDECGRTRRSRPPRRAGDEGIGAVIQFIELVLLVVVVFVLVFLPWWRIAPSQRVGGGASGDVVGEGGTVQQGRYFAPLRRGGGCGGGVWGIGEGPV